MNQLELEIGDAAGKIWTILATKGSMSKTQLGKAAGLSAHQLNQGIGWLAREGKLETIKEKKKELLNLRS